MAGKADEAPEGLMEAYYDLIVAKYKETRKANPEANIVMTFVAFNLKIRDYLRKQMGVTDFVIVTVPKDVIFKR